MSPLLWLVGLPLLVLAVILPAFLYLWLLWILDRYEKEPLPFFLGAFLWGAVPSTLLALFLEILAAQPVGALLSGTARSVVLAVLVAPVVEEGLKVLALLALFLLRPWDFDGPLDGILYGAAVGLGFAAVENALYFWSALQAAGLRGLTFLIVLRAGLFGLNHAFYTALTGLGLGLVRFSRTPAVRWGGFLLGFGASLFFHALHNFLVSVLGMAGLTASAAIAWGAVLLLGVVALLSARRERGWLESILGEEVEAGRLSPEMRDLLLSGRGRRRLRNQAFRKGGWTGWWLARRYIDLWIDLAYARAQRRMGDPVQTEARIERLRERLGQVERRLRILWEGGT